MKNLKSTIVFVLILIFAHQVLAEQYPKPISFVSDYAGAVPDDKEEQINKLIDEIEKNTTAEIAVLIIESLGGLPVETYAVELFREWGIGKKGADNGLLVLVSISDREYRIEVGYGLEGVLPDALAGRIARENFVPNFREGDYAKGIYDAIVDARDIILKDPSATAKYPSEEEMNKKFMVQFLIAAMIITASVLAIKFFIKDMEMLIIILGATAIILFAVSAVIAVYYIFGAVIYLIFKFLSGVKVPKGKQRGGIGKTIFGGSGSSSDSFGGFGGGGSGGGGASGKW